MALNMQLILALWVCAVQLKIQSPMNLGDLGLHVTHINFFANGVRLWPSNPIYVFANHLRYPAGTQALLIQSKMRYISM